jgi:hypothetical protein
MKDCTFKPNISATARALGTTMETAGGGMSQYEMRLGSEIGDGEFISMKN